MSKEQRISKHKVTLLTVHIVCATKYRYKVLTGDTKFVTENLLSKYVIQKTCVF